MKTPDALLCGCGHYHLVSVGEDGADAGCELIEQGCDCWTWRAPAADAATDETEAPIAPGMTHAGQPCDPSEAAAIRQFEIEAMVEAFRITVKEVKPRYLSETVAGLIAGGDLVRAAAIIFDRLYPPQHPRWRTPSDEAER